MDWNWFFSSLAQSGAALIGIIAAFIISKLLNESEKTEDLRNGLSKLKSQRIDIKKRIAVLDIGYYNKRAIRTNFPLSERIRKGEFEDKTPDEQEALLYVLCPKLFRNKSNQYIISEFFEVIRTENLSYPDKIEDEFGLNRNLPLYHPEIYNEIGDKWVEIERHKIESETLISSFYNLQKESLGKQQGFREVLFVLYALIFGVFCTVIYPLSFLPMGTNAVLSVSFNPSAIWSNIWSLKGLLLFLLIVFVEGILIYFVAQVYRLKGQYKEISDEMQDYHLNLRGYSEFFGEHNNIQYSITPRITH